MRLAAVPFREGERSSTEGNGTAETGHERDDVDRLMRAGAPVGKPDRSNADVEGAVVYAFSAHASAWLDAEPQAIAQAIRVSERAEMALYRSMRTEALNRLARDLEQVWTTRRERADDVADRHRLAITRLTELSWRVRRLQRRGPVLAIMSVIVELGVLRPLMNLQRSMTAQERRAVHDAAAKATARLKELRQEWRSARGIGRAPAFTRNERSSDQNEDQRAATPEPAGEPAVHRDITRRPSATASRPPGVMDASAPRSAAKAPSGATGRELVASAGVADAAPATDASPPRQQTTPMTGRTSPPEIGPTRQQLIIDYAIVLMARGAWFNERAQKLATLVVSTPSALATMARETYRERHGKPLRDALDDAEITALRRTVKHQAETMQFVDLLGLMQDFAKKIQGRSSRDHGRGR